MSRRNKFEIDENVESIDSLSDDEYEEINGVYGEYKEINITKEELDNRQDLLIGNKTPIKKMVFVGTGEGKSSVAKQIFFKLTRESFIKGDSSKEKPVKEESPKLSTFSWGKPGDKEKLTDDKKLPLDKPMGDFPSLTTPKKDEEKKTFPKIIIPKGKMEKAESPEKILGIKFSFTEEKNQRICRYFLNGEECPKGTECIFLHQVIEGKISDCYYGEKCNNDNCKYNHPNGKKDKRGSFPNRRDDKVADKSINNEGSPNPDIISDEFRKQKEKGLKKTKICREWERDGKCERGDECKFAHGILNLKKQECFFGVRCNNPHCKFNHTTNPKEKLLEKTKICRDWEKFGSCPRGDECTFAHGKSQLVLSRCIYGERCRNKDTCKYRHEEGNCGRSEVLTETTSPVPLGKTVPKSEMMKYREKFNESNYEMKLGEKNVKKSDNIKENCITLENRFNLLDRD